MTPRWTGTAHVTMALGISHEERVSVQALTAPQAVFKACQIGVEQARFAIKAEQPVGEFWDVVTEITVTLKREW